MQNIADTSTNADAVRNALKLLPESKASILISRSDVLQLDKGPLGPWPHGFLHDKDTQPRVKVFDGLLGRRGLLVSSRVGYLN